MNSLLMSKAKNKGKTFLKQIFSEWKNSFIHKIIFVLK